ncbi:MAG: hypothetical protein ABSE89_06795 [Sedimentisphaerales bacterium]
MDNNATTEDCSSPYFLDTSTQISRHWHDENTAQKVRADLFRKQLRCSIYVERQYRCRVLNALIFFHIIVKAEEDIEQAKQRLEKCRHKIALDDLVYKVGMRLFKKYNSQKPLLRYLKKLIEVDWENFFYDAVSRSLCDMTNCTRGAEAPQMIEQGYYLRISKECPENCKICEFWQAKKDDLQNLSQIDASKFTKINDPKGTMREIQAEAVAILNGKSPHGEPCRETLSDAVISIEARDSYPGITIHTMDSDFELLKEVLKTKVRLFKA